MKKKIVNAIFLISISITTMVFFIGIVFSFKPIHLESEYRSNRGGIYIFHIDGTFSEKVYSDGGWEYGRGVYVCDGDIVSVKFLSAPYWQNTEFSLSIQDRGKALHSGSVVYTSDMNMTIIFTLLFLGIDIGLIIGLYCINKSKPLKILELDNENEKSGE